VVYSWLALNILSDNIEPSLQNAAFERLLQQESHNEERERSRRVEPNTSDDTSPWLKFMQWDQTFRGKDLFVTAYGSDGR